jgi:hypothetical protein
MISRLAWFLITGLSSLAFADGEVKPRSQHATLVHEILALESEVVEVAPAMVELADAILDDAGELHLSKEARTPSEARSVLEQIDQLLARHGFAVPNHGRVELLSDALRPTGITAAAASRLAHPPNDRRAAQIRVLAGRGAAFHFFGGDQAAFLYMAIAEESGLPLTLMQRPGPDGPDAFMFSEDFIRYRLAGGGFYDWSVVTGQAQEDVRYSFALDRTMILGQVRWVRGGVWLRLGSYSRATADFRSAVEMFPGKAGIANSLAWLLATCPDPQFRDGAAAIGYAQTACREAPDCAGFRETLAAAFASVGRFAEAEATEREVAKHMAQSSRRSEYRYRAGLYHDHQPYLAPRRDEEISQSYCDRFGDRGGDDDSPLCPAR